jgi:hypothetical protein
MYCSVIGLLLNLSVSMHFLDIFYIENLEEFLP